MVSHEVSDVRIKTSSFHRPRSYHLWRSRNKKNAAGCLLKVSGGAVIAVYHQVMNVRRGESSKIRRRGEMSSGSQGQRGASREG